MVYKAQSPESGRVFLLDGNSVESAKKLGKLEKEHWTHSRKSLETLYYVAIHQFKLVLHLFFSELVALDVLYQARIIDSIEFKRSFEKLSDVYFGSHLSGELSEIIIQKFIALEYPNSNTNELGINLAKEFRTKTKEQ